MRLYRVTGFNGETGEEFHLGFHVAVSRDGAIAAARNRANRGLVLDACLVKELTPKEDLLFANAPWPNRPARTSCQQDVEGFACKVQEDADEAQPERAQ